MLEYKDDREEFANVIKEQVCRIMVFEGFISQADCEDFIGNYAVVFRSKGWFGKAIDKLFGVADEGKFRIDVMKMCGIPVEQEVEPKKKHKFKLLKLPTKE